MKRLFVLSLACALLLSLTPGAVSAYSHPDSFNQYDIRNIQPEKIQKWLQELLQQFYQQSDTQQPAPVNVTPVTPTEKESPSTAEQTGQLTAEEQQMVDLVNQERQKQGLAPLKVNNELVNVARVKAQDMIDNNYFDHESPTYGSPFEMMDQFNISYRTAGENLAGHQSVEGAHNGLMDSPGHRANILNGQFEEVGIGIVDGGPYGKMFVQLFKG